MDRRLVAPRVAPDALPEAVAQDLADALSLGAQLGTVAAQAMVNVMVLLGERFGSGERVIAITPVSYRLWCWHQRRLVHEWEVVNVVGY